MRSSSQSGKGVMAVLLLILFIGTLAAFAYLLSIINNKKFYLEPVNGYLQIKRGMMLPFGKEDYIPQDPEFRDLYSPIKIPEGQAVEAREFPDKSEMERVLFDLLMKWSADRVYSDNPEEFALGSSYMSRLARLKSSSDELRKVGLLKGDLLYKEGKKNFNDAFVLLKTAQKKFQESEKIGSGKYSDGDKYLKALSQAIDVMEGRATALSPEDVEALKKQAVAAMAAAASADGGTIQANDGGIAR